MTGRPTDLEWGVIWDGRDEPEPFETWQDAAEVLKKFVLNENVNHLNARLTWRVPGETTWKGNV